jgi:DNA-binding transcriptional ArsR family regulator
MWAAPRQESICIYEQAFIYSGRVKSNADHTHDRRPLPENLLSLDDAEQLAERFKLLAEPGRLRMVYALLEAGELCVSDLAVLVESSESATSHQLRQLRLARLVKARKQGREVFYKVADAHVRLLLDVTVEHYLHGHEDHP